MPQERRLFLRYDMHDLCSSPPMHRKHGIWRRIGEQSLHGLAPLPASKTYRGNIERSQCPNSTLQNRDDLINLQRYH